MVSLKIFIKNFFASKKSNFVILDLVEFFGYILSVIGLVYYFYGIIYKYYYEPDIGISESFKQARSIPFPAFTFCSPVVIRKDLVNYSQFIQSININKTIPKLSSIEQNFLATKGQICSLPNRMSQFEEGSRERSEKNIVKLLHQGAPNIDDTFARCGQHNYLKKCSLITSRSLTDLGMCYTFNMQSFQTIFNEKIISSDFDLYKSQNYAKDQEIWTLESGYTSDDENKIPYRSSLGQVFNFVFGVNESDTGSLCYHLKNSYKFYFHLPNEIPTIFHESDFVNFEARLNLKVTATISQTDKALKKYSPEKRKCFFENERKLKFFRTYTKILCNLECLTNFTLRRCGCVHFSHPRAEETRICDLSDVTCYKNAFYNWPKLDEMSNSTTLPCNCLPTCSNIEYRVKQRHVSQLSENNSLTLREIASEISYKKIFAALNVEFGDFLIMENLNYVSYTLENFIADCGGLLGLFLGFSFTALITFLRSMTASYNKQVQNVKVAAETFKKRKKNKVKRRKNSFVKNIENLKSNQKSLWEKDVDNAKDLQNLYRWQNQARQKINFRV